MSKMNPISGPFFFFISLKNRYNNSISTHSNQAGKIESRVPQVLLFVSFWKGKRLNPKKSVYPSCLNKVATSKPLQSLCSVLQNQDLRGKKKHAVARKGCPQREEGSGSYLAHEINEMKVSSWAPCTIGEGSLVPGEDDSQKPECWAGSCLSKPGARDVSIIPPLRAAHVPSSAQRADMVYGSPSKLRILNSPMCQIFRMSPILQFFQLIVCLFWIL